MRNSTLASLKMSNSPGSAPPPSTLGLNIDRCIISSSIVWESIEHNASIIVPFFQTMFLFFSVVTSVGLFLIVKSVKVLHIKHFHFYAVFVC